jgi:endonuclease V-like protein UPF0215 family
VVAVCGVRNALPEILRLARIVAELEAGRR